MILWEVRKQPQIYHSWHITYEMKGHLVFVPTGKIMSYAQTMKIIIPSTILFPKYFQ